MNEDEARQVWLKGFNSAASLCEKELKLLLDSAHYQAYNHTYALNAEALNRLKDQVAAGIYKEMRIADRAGLDYYFNAQKAS